MKITIKLILLFLIPGFLLFHGMYYIQTMSNLHNANNEISDISVLSDCVSLSVLDISDNQI